MPRRRTRSFRNHPRQWIVIASIFGCLISACTTPPPLHDRWPPKEGEPSRRIDVIYRDWHMIIVDSDSPSQDSTQPGFILWDFAERAWYLEGRQGPWGVCRSLLWPTTACTSTHHLSYPPWSVPDPRYPIEHHWVFHLSAHGHKAMRDYLTSVRGEPIPEYPDWHTSRRSYHLFYNCNQFTAKALREAGLPIRSWWAINAPLLGRQLNGALGYQSSAENIR